MRYTVKIGAVLLIVMGILTLTGATGGISADLAAGSGTVQEEPAGNSGEEAAPSGDSQEEHSGADSQEIPCPRSGLHPDGPVRPVPHPLGLPGEDGVSELLGYLVRPLQDGDAGHPGPV